MDFRLYTAMFGVRHADPLMVLLFKTSLYENNLGSTNKLIFLISALESFVCQSDLISTRSYFHQTSVPRAAGCVCKEGSIRYDRISAVTIFPCTLSKCRQHFIVQTLALNLSNSLILFFMSMFIIRLNQIIVNNHN